MKNSSPVDFTDPELQARVRRAASKAASQSGLHREVDDIEQEVWASLLTLDPDMSPEKVEAACSSIALYRRAVEYTRSRDPLSRPWRSEMMNASSVDFSKDSAQIMHEVGVPERMRLRAGTRLVDSQEMVRIPSRDRDMAEQVVMKEAIHAAIAEIMESKFDELDQAILHEYLINKTTVLAALADRFSLTESAVCLRVSKIRKQLKRALARQGVTAADLAR